MKDIVKSFLHDVRNHTINVIQDDGVNRHIKCSQSGFKNKSFEIVTYSGYLVICGDMGANIFSRVDDMFDFFNKKVEDGINPMYWSEKLQISGNERIFSESLVRKSIKQRINDIAEDINCDSFSYDKDEYNSVDEVRAAFKEEANEYFDGEDLSKLRYVSAIENYDSNVLSDLDFAECWEWICDREFSQHYLWQCYAIVWTIEQYLKNK